MNNFRKNFLKNFSQNFKKNYKSTLAMYFTKNNKWLYIVLLKELQEEEQYGNFVAFK